MTHHLSDADRTEAQHLATEISEVAILMYRTLLAVEAPPLIPGVSAPVKFTEAQAFELVRAVFYESIKDSL